MTLEQPVSTTVATGCIRDFGTINIGTVSSLIFTIKNTGADDLVITNAPQVVVTGADQSMFTVVTQPPSLIVAGDSATFTVQFAPTSGGEKSALVSIANNDSAKNPFLIQVTGTGLGAISDWRQFYFGSFANSGNGGDLNDYDKDGILNIMEYAFGTDPIQNSSGQLPAANLIGGNFAISFTQPAGVTGITYGAEWSATMLPTDWHPVSDSGLYPQHTFSVPVGSNTGLFMRLVVTSP
jgi:hypothetical protein